MKYWPYALSVVAGIAAGLAQLPYPWARIAAGAVSAGIAVTSSSVAITSRTVTKQASEKPFYPPAETS